MAGANGSRECAPDDKLRDTHQLVANHVFSESLANQAIEECRSGRVSSIVLVGQLRAHCRGYRNLKHNLVVPADREPT
jgi:hypothetical protein